VARPHPRGIGVIVVLVLTGVFAAFVGSQAGCADSCEPYQNCTTFAGLRYVDCGEDDHRFNDGTVMSSRRAAVDACWCSSEAIPCTDGRVAKMCNFIPRDGSTGVVLSDGTRHTLGDGMALCVGTSPCVRVSSGCEFDGWYLVCGAMTTARYFAATGRALATETQARASCRLQRSGVLLEEPHANEAGVGDASCEGDTACGWEMVP
jgi:hypothetical protein